MYILEVGEIWLGEKREGALFWLVENADSHSELRWYPLGSGCLIEVIKKAKFLKIKGYGAFFTILRGRSGDFK